MNFAKFHTRGGRGLQRAHPRIGLPLPPAQPRRGGAGRGGTVPRRRGARLPGDGGYRGTACAGRLPGGGRRISGARAYTGGRLRPGRYGAHVARRLPGRRIPGGGATGPNRAAVAPTWAATGRGATPAARAGYLYRGGVPGGAIPGAGYPAGGGRRARRHSYPRRGGYPGGVPGANMAISGAACDGYTPLGVSAAATGRGGLPGGGAEIFFRRGGYGGRKPQRLPLTRIYKKPFFGRRGEDTF